MSRGVFDFNKSLYTRATPSAISNFRATRENKRESAAWVNVIWRFNAPSALAYKVYARGISAKASIRNAVTCYRRTRVAMQSVNRPSSTFPLRSSCDFGTEAFWNIKVSTSRVGTSFISHHKEEIDSAGGAATRVFVCDAMRDDRSTSYPTCNTRRLIKELRYSEAFIDFTLR